MRRHFFGNDAFDDTMLASATIRETFWGLGGNDTFVFWDGDIANNEKPFFDRDLSDRFIGGTGRDLLKNLNVDFDDYTTYRLVSFDGGQGYDTIKYNVFDVLEDGNTATVELDRFKASERSVEHHFFDFLVTVVDGASADLNLKSGDGDQTVRLNMQLQRQVEIQSEVDITVELGNGNDRFEFAGEWQLKTRLQIDAGNGADVIIINDTTTENSFMESSQINGGAGNDTVVLEGLNKEIVRLGGGNDSVYVLTGSFVDAPDQIITGNGKDRVYLELDEYSTIARIRDFDPANDMVIFDTADFRNTDVTFKKAVADASSSPMLYMDNAKGHLYFGDNLMAVFAGGVKLTVDNFETGDFLF